ncbi:regulatory protein, tetR family [Lentibacillus persicus]|uniref:Regulatory protein, tetR family n=1 Tax=Lentibacillus persicus TaxID=640948 RepID=A0A1I1SGR8_9BACI|nr:TetR/AcrR family transcriptional regulator [Lentibacillus persicus]SFD43033.1 regulatory protein, tetR family [Lentibacillus persicus]
MKRSVDKRVFRTQKAFKMALLTLLKEKKFEDITITEIVKEADYNRGTFYIHFEQKENLLNEMINEVLQDMGNSFRKPYKNLEKEVSIVELSTTALFDHFLKNKELYKIMLSPNVNINFLDKMVETLKTHFKKDIDFVTDHSELDMKLFYNYRVYGIIGLILEWIKNDFQHSKQYMAEQVINIATFHTEKVYIKFNDIHHS